MKDLIARLEIIANEIDEHPHLNLLCFEYNPPLALEDIQSFVESEFGIKLPDKLKEVFTEVNGFKLEWEAIAKPDGSSIDEGSDVIGRIYIQDLYTIFEGPDGQEWKDIIWTEQMEPEEREEMKQFKPFDFFDPDDGGYVCLVLDNNQIASHLVLRSVDYGVRHLAINPLNYLNVLLQVRGYYHWQFFINPISELYNFRKKLQEISLFLPGYFPDASLNWMNEH